MKAVLFDIDDTLFSTTEFARRARRNAVEAMIARGIDATPDEVAAELQEVLREFGSNYNQHFNKLIQRMPPHQVRDVNPALVVAAGVVAYHDTKFEHLRAFDDVVPFLEALRDARMRTGIITHGWTTKQSEKLIRLGLVDLFGPRDVFISDQVGISKPNPKLYQHALRQLGLLPGEVMYVGDNLANDIVPPKSIGMHTCWIRRAARDGQDVEAAGPEFVVDDLRELAEILRDRFHVPLAAF
ncbi:MAG: TIGR02253 family HAD-type hydrolase [Planctomycetota bacterium]